MDVHTLTRIIQDLKGKYKSAQERFNLHPSDPYVEGRLMGLYEALLRVEHMLQEEIDHREEHA